jgi:conserved domain protein
MSMWKNVSCSDEKVGEKLGMSIKKILSILSNFLMKEKEIAFNRREKIN